MLRSSSYPRHPESDSASSASDAPSSLRLTGAARRMQALLDTNALLATLGFGARAFEDYDDLVASVSSMGVALYEKLFQFHLDDVIRVPRSNEDYVHNAQLVVDALSAALLDEQFDARQLTGEALCDGDVASIQQLIGMFQHIHSVLYSSESSGVARDQSQGAEELLSDQHEDVSRDATPLPRAQREAKKTTRSDRNQSKPVTATTTARSRTTTSAVRDRRVAATTTGRRAVNAGTKPRTTATHQPSTKMKKRTRRVETSSNLKASGQRRKDEELEQELLTTQRYGRYVPVPQRSTRQIHEPLDDDLEADFGSGVELNDNELAAGETYFGGVSSVSGASGSAASIHFMEEEGEFAQNFSAIQSHSSPGTNSKDSPEMDSTPNRSGQVDESTPRKSKNQEDADDEVDGNDGADDDGEGTTSPVKKKLATAKVTMSPMKQTRTRQIAGRTPPQQQHSKPSLYPLQPETVRHDRTSKSYKEYMRYKIQLKDHLQELRQREYCQRQHLERAYRLGEHAANVERIRARRFEQELRMHRISIGLDAKTQEEKQLRDAMQHMLRLEKEKLRDEHRTTAKTLQQIQRDHAEREQALETFYATQIQLVKEQTRRELDERQTVEKAHRLASEQMIREMRRERERELATLLKEKQHLAEVRRFRHATQLTQAIEKGTEISARQGDAFYAAAMKARQLRASASNPTNNTGKATKPSTATRQVAKATKAVYGSRNGGRTAVRV